jgi:hypothetical protein
MLGKSNKRESYLHHFHNQPKASPLQQAKETGICTKLIQHTINQVYIATLLINELIYQAAHIVYKGIIKALPEKKGTDITIKETVTVQIKNNTYPTEDVSSSFFESVMVIIETCLVVSSLQREFQNLHVDTDLL